MARVRRTTLLWVLCVAQAGVVLVFLNFAGALPLIQAEWGLTNAQAGAIQAATQVGYLLSVLVLSSLSDFMPPERLLVFGAVAAMIANLLFALIAMGVTSAIILRLLVGSGIAGIYMPGVKVISQHVPRAHRGRAMGFFVASFTVGSAASVALGGSLSGWFGWRPALGAMSLGPLVAAGAAWVVARLLQATGSRAAEAEPAHTSVRKLLHNRRALLVIAAYAAHVWELFGLRSWLPAFITAAFIYRGAELTAATRWGATVAGAATLMGAFSIVIAAFLSDKVGRAPTIIVVASMGFLSTLGLGFGVRWHPALLIGAALLTAFLLTADSAVISTTLTETVPQAFLGRALAIYSFCGFLAGSLSPLAFGVIQDETGDTWRWAFASLAAGGLVASVIAIFLHHHLRMATRAAKPT